MKNVVSLVNEALTKQEQKHQLEMHEMATKMSHLQEGETNFSIKNLQFSVINIMSSKMASMETLLKDFDLMRDSFEISKEMRDESNKRYDILQKEINKNRIR